MRNKWKYFVTVLWIAHPVIASAAAGGDDATTPNPVIMKSQIDLSAPRVLSKKTHETLALACLRYNSNGICSKFQYAFRLGPRSKWLGVGNQFSSLDQMRSFFANEKLPEAKNERKFSKQSVTLKFIEWGQREHHDLDGNDFFWQGRSRFWMWSVGYVAGSPVSSPLLGLAFCATSIADFLQVVFVYSFQKLRDTIKGVDTRNEIRRDQRFTQKITAEVFNSEDGSKIFHVRPRLFASIIRYLDPAFYQSQYQDSKPDQLKSNPNAQGLAVQTIH